MGHPMFSAAAEDYDRLMGRFIPSLAPLFADTAEIVGTERALDVGCGPGGLTRELARRVGPDSVTAIDPSPLFVEACRERVPGVHAHVGVAESLPFEDGAFDAALSSLVVGFMSDPAQGVREMTRVTRPGGVVALCFWDVTRMEALAGFWRAAQAVVPSAPGERLAGTREGELGGLLASAGCTDIVETTIAAAADYAGFDDYWAAFSGGVGPVGSYYATLDPETQGRVRATAHEMMGSPDGPFTLAGIAWAARGTAPARN